MRTLLVALLVVVPLGTAADASAFRQTTKRAPWALIDVSKGGRVLRLEYIGDGLVVHLKHPLDGRRIRGHARGSRAVARAVRLFRLRDQDVVWLVPGVVGLAPHDARRLLRLQGYEHVAVKRADGCARRAQVTAQWPHAHSVRRSDRVGLVVRRACG